MKTNMRQCPSGGQWSVGMRTRCTIFRGLMGAPLIPMSIEKCITLSRQLSSCNSLQRCHIVCRFFFNCVFIRCMIGGILVYIIYYSCYATGQFLQQHVVRRWSRCSASHHNCIALSLLYRHERYQATNYSRSI